MIYAGARIGIEGRPELVTCRIVDVSATGARLELDGADSLPDSFVLIISYDRHLRRHCSVVWRSPTAVGVEFNPPVEATGKKGDDS